MENRQILLLLSSRWNSHEGRRLANVTYFFLARNVSLSGRNLVFVSSDHLNLHVSVCPTLFCYVSLSLHKISFRLMPAFLRSFCVCMTQSVVLFSSVVMSCIFSRLVPGNLLCVLVEFYPSLLFVLFQYSSNFLLFSSF